MPSDREIVAGIRRAGWRTLVAVALAVGIVVALAGPAVAHAQLQGSDPAGGATLAHPPPVITLDFDEEVEAALGGIRLYDAQGRQFDVAAPRRVSGDASQVTARLPALADGTYVVSWRVTSADSHPVTGAFTFVVGTGGAADAGAVLAGLRDGGGGAARVGLAVARGVGYLGLAMLIGGLVFVAGVWPDGAERRRVRRWLWLGWGMALAGALGAFALQGPYATGLGLGHAVDRDLWDAVSQTRFGNATLARAVLLAGGGIALLITVTRTRTGPWRAGGLALGALTVVSVALAGHAGTERLAGLGLVADVAHVAAMCVWLGGLAVLALVARPGTDAPGPARSVGAATATELGAISAAGSDGGEAGAPDSAGTSEASAAHTRATRPPINADGPPRLPVAALDRFSTLALAAVAVLVVSGVTQAWRLVGGLEALVRTGYGRLLLAKTVLVAVMVALGAASRRALRRRQGRSLIAYARDELAFGVVVLAVTAVLAGTPPAPVETSEPFTVSLARNDLVADVTLDPARSGRNTLHLLFTPAGGSLQRLTGVRVRATLPERQLGPLPVRVDAAGPNHWVATGFELPYRGEWQLEILVQVTEFEQVRLATTVPVR